MLSQATLLPLVVAWQLPGAPAFGVRKVMSLPTSGGGGGGLRQGVGVGGKGDSFDIGCIGW